ncbi:unnamed protein product [Rhodiola kirilowii]
MAVAPLGKLNVGEITDRASRTVECFEKLEQIGEGAFGQVFMAREIATGEIVALKRIRMEKERKGVPMTALREIKILQELNHPNVIKLKEIVMSTNENKYRGDIYLVFEYMDHDLTGLSERPGIQFTVPQIKCYMKQLLDGLQYCHLNQVLHRDIKGSNLLINNEGILKLADFGLARSLANDHDVKLTNLVVTLWYRPPEVLLGATKYGPAVDMWSVGCILAELLYGKIIFPGKNVPDQIKKIYELCGSPDEVNWPGVSKMPRYNKFKASRSMERRLREVFSCLDCHAVDLLDKMLTLDPAQRISAIDALDAEYFLSDPVPCDPKSLPQYESSHEFQTNKIRQLQRQKESTAKWHKMQLQAQPRRHGFSHLFPNGIPYWGYTLNGEPAAPPSRAQHGANPAGPPN